MTSYELRMTNDELRMRNGRSVWFCMGFLVAAVVFLAISQTAGAQTKPSFARHIRFPESAPYVVSASTFRAGVAEAETLRVTGTASANASIAESATGQVVYATNTGTAIKSLGDIELADGKGLINPAGDLTLELDDTGNDLEFIGGDVGIGTTAPVNKLDVEGGAAIGASYSGTSSAPSNGLIVEGTVGVMTSSPGAPLTVAGDVRAGPSSTGAATGQIFRVEAAGSDKVIDAGVQSDSPWGTWIQSRAKSNSAANVLVINPHGGNVGIRTAAPDEELHLYNPSGAVDLVLKVENDTQTITRHAGVLVRNASDVDLSLRSWSPGTGATRFGLSYDNLTVVESYGADNTAMVVGTYSAVPLVFGTNNTERARILSGGKLAVNDTAVSATAVFRANGVIEGEDTYLWSSILRDGEPYKTDIQQLTADDRQEIVEELVSLPIIFHKTVLSSRESLGINATGQSGRITDGAGIYTKSYLGALHVAFQELAEADAGHQDRILVLENKVATLEGKVERLLAEVGMLKGMDLNPIEP